MAQQASLPGALRQRRLIPRHLPSSQADIISTIPTPPSLRSRPSPTAAACVACRSRKAKCFGERPSCRRCARQQIQCIYTTRLGETPAQALSRSHGQLQNRVSTYEELFELLRNLPNQDAQRVLHMIRSGEDAAAIINHVKTGDVLLQLAVVPETRLRYELPYRSEMPASLNPDSPYLQSIIYESTSLFATVTHPRSLWSQDSYQATTEGHHLEQYQSTYLKPFHAAQVCEPQLDDVKVSRWTEVCSNDNLMRDLLREFFRCEYQFTSAFQKDLFLADMGTMQTDFCSSMLVNVVLAYSCVCYSRLPDRKEYWNPSTLLYRFLAEAKRLWELEAAEPRVTTVQAGIIFTVVHNLCGQDEIGKAYRRHAVAMAHALHLFTEDHEEGDDRLRRGRGFTAWTLYNWETLTAFSFMHPPLLTETPAWSLPDPMEDPHWYGEVWVRYAMDKNSLPSSFGSNFREKCRFRVIMNEFCNAAYSSNQVLRLDEVKQLHKRLEAWFYNLPNVLKPQNIVLPGHLQLHMYYQHLILSMYSSFLQTETKSREFIEQTVADAKRNLEILIRLYYLRHGFEAMDLFIVIPLTMTALDSIDAIDKQSFELDIDTLRSTIVLTVQGLYNQRKNHYLASALFWVVRGRMRPQEIDLLLGNMNLADEKPDVAAEMTQVVRSSWPIKVVADMREVDSCILSNQVRDYVDIKIGEPMIEA